jgi:hypothetical protein
VDDAIAEFERELALESGGHLYARECSAQAWYAKGACLLRGGDVDAARLAFGEALSRVPRHPMAIAGMAIAGGAPVASAPTLDSDASRGVDVALAHAALLIAGGDAPVAAQSVATALDRAPVGNAGWLIPVEPLLAVSENKSAWTSTLAVLRARAGG